MSRTPTARRYSDEKKAAAVRVMRTLRAERGTNQGTVQRVARQLGYGVASRMRTEMVLDAIEMARGSRAHHHDDLRCHGDAGSQLPSIRYGEQLAEIGDVPPAEFENAFYAAQDARKQLVEIKQRESPSDPGRFTHYTSS